MEYTTLNIGQKMQMLGYGTYKITHNDDIEGCIINALDVGYRHIDTATLYDNEEGIGRAIRNYGIAREQLFLTSKLWTNINTYDLAIDMINSTLSKLQTNYLDLLLIHWPTNSNLEVYKAMCDMQSKGFIRAVGVSNFKEHHIDDLIKNGLRVPSVNQVEFHPYFQQLDLLKYCKDLNIQLEAWSPLGRGAVLTDKTLLDIANNHNKTASQIALRYLMDIGVSVIPKSTHIERIKENYNIFDFSLTSEERERIKMINKNTRLFKDPDNHGF